MKTKIVKQLTTALGVKVSLILLAASSPANAAKVFTLDNSQTNFANGVAVWDIVDGTMTGTGTFQSTAPILSADPANQTWTFDLSLAYSWTYDYVVTSTAPPSGGGAPVEDHEVEVFTWELSEETASSWEESYFTGPSRLVSGDATYGENSGQNGVIVLVDDSGTGQANSYVSGAGGSEWELTGSGSGGGGGYSIGGSYAGGGSGTGTGGIGLTLTAVPEPSSVSLLALGAVTLGFRRKR